MTIWIGLTGGIGSGKSQAAAEFLSLGVPVVDADQVSRSLTADGGAALPAIYETFGADVFHHPQSINRAALRSRVFADEEAKAKLEGLMFPLILAGLAEKMAVVDQAPFAILDVPLLVEQPVFRRLVDRVLVVEADTQQKIERVRLRSGLEEQAVRQIMATQASDAQRRWAADDILLNNDSLACLQQKVRRLYGSYRIYWQ